MEHILSEVTDMTTKTDRQYEVN